MGLFRPVHDDYSHACFKMYLLYRCTFCGMTGRETLSQARSALEQHCTTHWEYFRRSNLDKQLTRVKKGLYAARTQVAREAQYGDWSTEGLAAFAQQAHKVIIAGVTGDSDSARIVRRKMDLLEQISILEVCSELGIDLFNGDG